MPYVRTVKTASALPGEHGDESIGTARAIGEDSPDPGAQDDTILADEVVDVILGTVPVGVHRLDRHGIVRPNSVIDLQRGQLVRLVHAGCHLKHRATLHRPSAVSDLISQQRHRLCAVVRDARCSIFREPRREGYTICTAVAADAVFTVRTYGIGQPTVPDYVVRKSSHYRR